MITYNDLIHINAYINNKLKVTQEKREKILGIINRLIIVSIKNDTQIVKLRYADIVNSIHDELKQHYRIIRMHIGDARYDSRDFNDILSYFDEQYIKKNKIAVLIRILEKQLEKKNDARESPQFKDAVQNGVSKNNGSTISIEKVLIDWKNTIESVAEPMLRKYLSDVNDVVLYYHIKEAISRSIDSSHDIKLDSTGYNDLKNSFVYFFEILMKLRQEYISCDEIKELINRNLQQMGFKNIILNMRTINQEKFKAIIEEIIKEFNMGGHINKFTPPYHNAIQLIQVMEKNEYN